MKNKSLFIFLIMISVTAALAHVTRAADEKCTHQVVKGDTLWHISGSYLQDPRQWPRIWKNNPAIDNPNLIYPRQLIALPGDSVSCNENQCIHHVVKGDTLWHISTTYLRDPLLWPRIWKNNPEIKNPNLIYPKQQIRVPCAEKQTVAAAPPPAPAPVEEPAPQTPEPPTMDLGELSGEPGGPNQVLFAGDAGSMTMGTPVAPGIGAVIEKPAFYGTVTGRDNWKFAGSEEILTISLPGAVDGQRYGVYRDLGRVRHPDGGWLSWTSYGNLIMEVGVVEVISTGSTAHTARVVETFHHIQASDHLGPVPERPMLPPADQGTFHSNLSATIIAIHSMRNVAAGRDIVYIDRGEEDGVVSGDALYVTDQKSRQAVVRVITVTPTTATALVMPTTPQYIFPGERLAANP